MIINHGSNLKEFKEKLYGDPNKIYHDQPLSPNPLFGKQ